MKTKLIYLTAPSVALAASSFALAADHLDSPATMAEPTADITDVYAFMSNDAAKLNLIMNVAPNAGQAAAFGTEIVYAFHLNRSAGYGLEQTETRILCKFYDAANLECWAGDEYVEGDPSDESGIASATDRLRVFAGLRDDPFFFELTGFKAVASTITSVASTLSFDANGCPTLDATTASTLVMQLQNDAEGAPASNTFAGQNVLSLVVSIDKNLVGGTGDIVGVWGSTHRAQ